MSKYNKNAKIKKKGRFEFCLTFHGHKVSATSLNMVTSELFYYQE